MTNQEALELAIKLVNFCDEHEYCSECIFSKRENDAHTCGLKSKMPSEWSINITKLSKKEDNE